MGHVSIIGPHGETTMLHVSGDPRDVYALLASVVVPMAEGIYRLRWRVVSADGHPVEGSYRFAVGDVALGSLSAADSAAADSADEAMAGEHEMMTPWGPSVSGAPLIPSLLRGVAMGTLMATAGLLLFLTMSPDGSAAARAMTYAKACSLVAVVALALHFCAWMMNASPEHQLGGDAIGTMVGTGIARVEFWRIGLAILSVWALILARHARIALLFAFLALVVSGGTGHSAAIQPMWTAPAKALHLVAGAVWLGGLLWLIVLDRTDSAHFAGEAERVSRLALLSVGAVTISGVIQTYLFLPSWMALLHSSYGLVTLAKVAGLLILVAFGAHHRLRVVPNLRHDSAPTTAFGRTLRLELMVMIVVVLLGGLLGYLAPPGDPHAPMEHHQPSETE